ncbi:hypothetical protein ACWDE9_45180, partial [Streptomyces olivaceoviridis]
MESYDGGVTLRRMMYRLVFEGCYADRRVPASLSEAGEAVCTATAGLGVCIAPLLGRHPVPEGVVLVP